MQTNPIATTSVNGQGKPSPAAAGKSGSGAGEVFAGLIQALTGGAQVTTVPAASSGPQAGAVAGQAGAAEGDGEAQSAEAANEADMTALAQLQGLELPPPPLASPGPPVDDAAPAAPGAVTPQVATTVPDAAAAPAAPSAAAADTSANVDGDAATPPSAQAVELAKVLGAGTQFHVTRAIEGSAPTPAPVHGLAAVSVAAAMEEASVAAVAVPAFRAASPEPEQTSPVTTVASSPTTDGEHAPAVPAAVLPAKRAGLRDKADAAPGAAQQAAAGGTAPPAASSSPTAATPNTAAGEGHGEAAPVDPAAFAAFGRESQPGQQQAQAPAPAAAMPERAPASAVPASPAGQVSLHFAKAVRAGVDRIEIQLAPASLGRVEISLDLSDTHRVHASISVETNEALELLRADARVLERALQDAGLKTDQGSLSFQLRDHGGRAGQDGPRHGFGAHPGNGREAEDPAAGRAAEASARAAAHPAPPGNGRIDIHA